jgi:hypothetical protein
VIIRIGLVNRLHRVRVRLGAGFVIQFLGIAIKGRNGGNVCLLARSDMSVSSLRFVNLVKAALDHFGVWVIPKLVP